MIIRTSIQSVAVHGAIYTYCLNNTTNTCSVQNKRLTLLQSLALQVTVTLYIILLLLFIKQQASFTVARTVLQALVFSGYNLLQFQELQTSVNIFFSLLTVLVWAPSTITPSLYHSMVDKGLAPRETHVKLYEIPAVNRISVEPSITGSSGGTKEKNNIPFGFVGKHPVLNSPCRQRQEADEENTAGY